jgi:serine-type D-Ala-D-Ala carboxypeptidase/endopeptidase (penicillin-binding protein 4)
MVIRRKIVLPIVFALMMQAMSFTDTSSRDNTVRKAIEDFSKNETLLNASWGFYAVHAANGQEIASHNPDLALTPASTLKVVTTLTGLLILGNDYRFETLLQHDGIIQNGVLQGNLYITGTGDPTLGSTRIHDSLSLENVLKGWINDLARAGIRQIQGSLIADASYFDDHIAPPKWIWEDMGNYYGAGAHALTINENMYTVFFEPGRREGQPAAVLRVIPDIADMTYVNHVNTGARGSGDNVCIYGAPYSNQRWFTGTVPLGESNFTVRGSIPDPGHFLATTFKSHLQANGIILTGDVSTHRTATRMTAAPSRITLSRRFSPPLHVIAARTNFHSINTYAENLVKTLGKVQMNDGSFRAGATVISDFWLKNGIDTRGMRMHDGSGLSPLNNITSRQITQMLLHASRNEALYNTFTEGLPVANRTGSLARMFANTPSAGVLRAKSGFLGNVRAYSGYTRNRSGQLIAFTIIVNNYGGSQTAMRQRMEVVMDALTRMN